MVSTRLALSAAGLAALLFAACSPEEFEPITTGPNKVRTPPGCARRQDDGGYLNERLKVPCRFARFNGAMVCVPSNLPTIIGGSCVPGGPANGQGKVQLDLSKDSCGAPLAKFALTRTDEGTDCNDFAGNIRQIIPETLADQRTYFGTDNLHCEPSPLSARLPDYPYVDLALPVVLLYEDDMPLEICK